ncbi:unnamed protein product [Amoebophrya sp. A120]|nr:unnamed protein product [Amoebophrya sp. A120]|eukprot:GSA120T00004501001.1
MALSRRIPNILVVCAAVILAPSLSTSCTGTTLALAADAVAVSTNNGEQVQDSDSSPPAPTKRNKLAYFEEKLTTILAQLDTEMSRELLQPESRLHDQLRFVDKDSPPASSSGTTSDEKRPIKIGHNPPWPHLQLTDFDPNSNYGVWRTTRQNETEQKSSFAVPDWYLQLRYQDASVSELYRAFDAILRARKNIEDQIYAKVLKQAEIPLGQAIDIGRNVVAPVQMFYHNLEDPRCPKNAFAVKVFNGYGNYAGIANSKGETLEKDNFFYMCLHQRFEVPEQQLKTSGFTQDCKHLPELVLAQHGGRTSQENEEHNHDRERQSPKMFLDVGANVGYCTLLMASLGYLVLSFEPLLESFELIKASVALNPKMDNRVLLFNVALGKSSGNFVTMDTGRIGNRGNTRVVSSTGLMSSGSAIERTTVMRGDASQREKTPPPFNVNLLSTGVEPKTGSVVFFSESSDRSTVGGGASSSTSNDPAGQPQEVVQPVPDTSNFQPLSYDKSRFVPQFALADLLEMAEQVTKSIPIGLIKIDAEGSEFDVLQGMMSSSTTISTSDERTAAQTSIPKNVLCTGKIPKIKLELCPHLLEKKLPDKPQIWQILTFLHRHGYLLIEEEESTVIMKHEFFTYYERFNHKKQRDVLAIWQGAVENDDRVVERIAVEYDGNNNAASSLGGGRGAVGVAFEKNFCTNLAEQEVLADVALSTSTKISDATTQEPEEALVHDSMMSKMSTSSSWPHFLLNGQPTPAALVIRQPPTFNVAERNSDEILGLETQTTQGEGTTNHDVVEFDIDNGTSDEDRLEHFEAVLTVEKFSSSPEFTFSDAVVEEVAWGKPTASAAAHAVEGSADAPPRNSSGSSSFVERLKQRIVEYQNINAARRSSSKTSSSSSTTEDGINMGLYHRNAEVNLVQVVTDGKTGARTMLQKDYMGSRTSEKAKYNPGEEKNQAISQGAGGTEKNHDHGGPAVVVQAQNHLTPQQKTQMNSELVKSTLTDAKPARTCSIVLSKREVFSEYSGKNAVYSNIEGFTVWLCEDKVHIDHAGDVPLRGPASTNSHYRSRITTEIVLLLRVVDKQKQANTIECLVEVDPGGGPAAQGQGNMKTREQDEQVVKQIFLPLRFGVVNVQPAAAVAAAGAATGREDVGGPFQAGQTTSWLYLNECFKKAKTGSVSGQDETIGATTTSPQQESAPKSSDAKLKQIEQVGQLVPSSRKVSGIGDFFQPKVLAGRNTDTTASSPVAASASSSPAVTVLSLGDRGGLEVLSGRAPDTTIPDVEASTQPLETQRQAATVWTPNGINASVNVKNQEPSPRATTLTPDGATASASTEIHETLEKSPIFQFPKVRTSALRFGAIADGSLRGFSRHKINIANMHVTMGRLSRRTNDRVASR